MVEDSGCTKALVHGKYVKGDAFTGDKTSVPSATGERIIVPLALVELSAHKERMLNWSER